MKPSDHLELTLGKCIYETEHKIKVVEKIGMHKLSLRMTADIGLQEYCTYLSEIRNAVMKKEMTPEAYPELKDAAKELSVIQFNSYKARFEAYDRLLSLVVIGWVIAPFLSLIYFRPSFHRLKRQLWDVHSSLSHIKLMIHAASN
jgi:hypothetical protein